MTEFEKQSIAIALKKMFQGTHFNICTVDNCLKIAGVIPLGKDYQVLAALHCIDWKDMPLDFRNQVFVNTLDLFRHAGFQLEQIAQLGATGRLRVLQ